MKKHVEMLLEEVSKSHAELSAHHNDEGILFNLVHIMKMHRDEVRTHTPILAEILNPKGLHGKGASYLDIFLQLLGIEAVNTVNAIVTREKRFSGESDGADAGQIDLQIELEKQHIIIENKIYAEDMKRQLCRYHTEIGLKSDKDIILVYLSPHGRKPSKASLGDIEVIEGLYYRQNEPVNIKVISYRDDICVWLTRCIREVEASQYVISALQQYLQSVERLTGKIMTQSEAVKQILLTKKDNAVETLLAAQSISDVFISDSFRGAVLERFFMDLLEKLPAFVPEITHYEGKDFSDIKFTRDKCNYWFSSVKAENQKKRDGVGLVFSVRQSEDLYFVVLAATDWLHYGFVNKVANGDDLVSALSPIELAEWKIQENWSKFPCKRWISRPYKNIRDFKSDAIRLMTCPEELHGLMTQMQTDVRSVIKQVLVLGRE